MIRVVLTVLTGTVLVSLWAGGVCETGREREVVGTMSGLVMGVM